MKHGDILLIHSEGSVCGFSYLQAMKQAPIFWHTRCTLVILRNFFTDCVAKSESRLVLIACSVAGGIFVILFATFVICYIRHKKVRGKANVSDSPQSGRRNEGLELQET